MSATILLVDYDPRSIARIRGILAPLGARMILATDGESAVQEFELWRPDLTLVQDLVPRKHGFDVCKDIKTTEHGKCHRVVLLSFRRPGRRSAPRVAHCDAVLEKPFDDGALFDLVLRMLPADSLAAHDAAEHHAVTAIVSPRAEPIGEAPAAAFTSSTETVGDDSIASRWAALPLEGAAPPVEGSTAAETRAADLRADDIEIEIVLDETATLGDGHAPENSLALPWSGRHGSNGKRPKAPRPRPGSPNAPGGRL